MKTAVIYSGHTRTFDACFPSHQRLVMEPAERDGTWASDVHVFFSTVQDADASKAERLHNFYENVKIEAVPQQPDCIAWLRSVGCNLPARWVKGTPYMGERYPISAHPQAVARQLWQLDRAWQMVEMSGERYERVVRIRPDLLMHHCEMPKPSDHFAHVPWWGKFDGCNDRFAVLGWEAAKRYFTTWRRLPDMLKEGADLHPETLIRRSLVSGGIHIDSTLGALFSTLRSNGEVRPPEIIGPDIEQLANARR